MAFCGYDDSPTVTVERRRALAYVFGALFGLVWLWFWIKGHWFAALIGMAPGLALWVAASQINIWVVAFLLGSWLPMLARPAFRRLARDLRVIAGKDAEFADSLSLEIRDPR